MYRNAHISPNLRRLTVSLGLMGLLALALMLAAAAMPGGPEAGSFGPPITAALSHPFLVTDAPSAQYDPAIAHNPDNDSYVVVFEDFRSSGSTEIYRQRLTGDGRLLGDPLPITNDTVSQNNPQIAYLAAAGRYLVVWQDYRHVTQTPDVYGQLLDQDGQPVGGNFPVASGPGGQVSAQIAASEADASFFVIWGNALGTSAVQGQRVGGDGTLLDPVVSISDGAGWAGQASLAYSVAAGRYTVAWADNRVGPATGIYAQLVEANGTLVSGNFVVSDDMASQEWPVLGGSAVDGRFLIVWEDWRSGDRDLYARLFDAAGLPVGDEFPLAADFGPETFATIVNWPDPTQNEFLVAWQTLTGRGDAVGQRLATDGSFVGDRLIISDDPLTQANLALAVAYGAPEPGYLVVWEDYRTTDNAGVYGQRLAVSGGGVDEPFGVTPLNGRQVAPAIAYSASSDRFLVAWPHYEAGRADVLAYLVLDDGRLRSHPITVITDTQNIDLHVTAAWDSANDRFLVAWEALAPATVDDFNIYGRLLDSNGLPFSPAFTISDAPGQQHHPAAAFDPDLERFLVAFESVDLTGMSTAVNGQLLAADGTPLVTATAVNFPIGAPLLADARRPDLAYDPGQAAYLVVWQDNRAGAHSGDWDVLGRLVAASDGSPLAAEFGVADDPALIEEAPRLARDDANGRYLVAWQHTVPDAIADPDIYARLLDADGLPLTGPQAIANGPLLAETGPAVAWHAGNGRYLVAWSSGEQTALPFAPDIYGRPVGADGAPGAGLLSIGLAQGAQQWPRLAARQGVDEWLVVWQDGRADVGLDKTAVYARRQAATKLGFLPAVLNR